MTWKRCILRIEVFKCQSKWKIGSLFLCLCNILSKATISLWNDVKNTSAELWQAITTTPANGLIFTINNRYIHGTMIYEEIHEIETCLPFVINPDHKTTERILKIYYEIFIIGLDDACSFVFYFCSASGDNAQNASVLTTIWIGERTSVV